MAREPAAASRALLGDSMVCTRVRISSLLIGSIMSTVPVMSQTIPQQLAEANESLSRSIRIETGPPPSVESIVRLTEVIVEGTVGSPRTYLSEDEMEVYSDYPILNPVYKFGPAVVVTAPGVTRSVAVTHIGGTIVRQGHSFTLEHKELPPLTPGMRCLFLLTVDGDQYRVAGKYYGVFRIDPNRLTPMTTQSAFARELRDLSPADAVNQIVALARQRRH